jgi:hypothetical protein
MTRAILVALCLGLLAATGVAADFPRSFQEHAAVQESLARVHPRMRASWLRERGVEDPYYTAVRRPDSGQGLREVGRWSYGPSYDVDGRTTPSETLVALARGSGVSLLRFSRQDSLSENQGKPGTVTLFPFSGPAPAAGDLGTSATAVLARLYAAGLVVDRRAAGPTSPRLR